MAKKKRRKNDGSLSKGMTGLLLVGVVFVAGFVLWAVLSSKPKYHSEPEYTPKVSKKVSRPKVIEKSSSMPSSLKESTKDEEDLNAIAGGAQGRINKYLERQDDPITDSDQVTAISSYLNTVVDLIQRNKDAKAPHDYGLDDSMGLAMLDTFKTAINAGYSVDSDSVKAYESDHSNVIQYTFTMSRDGKSSAFFIGNYLPNIGKGTITRMEGNLDNVAFE